MNTATLPMPAADARPQAVAIDREAVLRYLDIDPRKPATQALLLTCERYGLDPVLKHAVLISGRLYVTRDGLLHVAHRDGRLDGIVVEDQMEDATHWMAKVAVYRKDMRHPFTYIGRYPKSGHQKTYGPEMAVKCAEVMALRRAFDISLCAREEAWDAEDAPAPARHVEPPKKPLHRERYPSDQAPPPPEWDVFLNDAAEAWGEFEPIKDDKDWTARCQRLVNRIVTDAIEDDLIAEESILKPAAAGQEPRRDPRKAWDAARWLYETQTDTVRLIVRTALDRKRAEAAAPAEPDDRMSANPEPTGDAYEEALAN